MKSLLATLSLSLTLALGVVLAGCDLGGPQNCTALYAYGLTITVEDDAGGRICDADVTITDGDYVETAEAFPGDECSYVGAGERAGTYTIEAAKEGFVTAVEEGVVVGEDECHVIGEQVTLVLVAE